MSEEKKPYVTPDNMSRIIQQWFANSKEAQILLTDKDFEDSNVPGIVFSMSEFMDMLKVYDKSSDEILGLRLALDACVDGGTFDMVRDELKALYRAYVRLLEAGRDRIIDHGGTCDLVDVMEAGDPALISVRTLLAKLKP